MTGENKGLSGTALKAIAAGCMLLDHIAYFFGFTGAIPAVFAMLGRLAAPLFLFCLAEGFAHTHDRRRYFLRIYAMAAAMGALYFAMA
ncbi:MAG: conjugal transfer protein TraX, partial [Clostridiales bacterium]|nr:conjugal transfer protein TraX [Clostridiales bacterium]